MNWHFHLPQWNPHKLWWSSVWPTKHHWILLFFLYKSIYTTMFILRFTIYYSRFSKRYHVPLRHFALTFIFTHFINFLSTFRRYYSIILHMEWQLISSWLQWYHSFLPETKITWATIFWSYSCFVILRESGAAASSRVIFIQM